MIRPLRQRHRRMMLGLALFLPTALVVGLTARKPLPTVLAPENRKASGQELVWSQDDLWPERAVRTELHRDKDNKHTLWLVPLKPLVSPDVLVYWTDQNESARVPDRAILLGAPDQPLAVPAEAFRQPGRLLLYSLADQKVLAQSSLFRFSQ